MNGIGLYETSRYRDQYSKRRPISGGGHEEVAGYREHVSPSGYATDYRGRRGKTQHRVKEDEFEMTQTRQKHRLAPPHRSSEEPDSGVYDERYHRQRRRDQSRHHKRHRDGPDGSYNRRHHSDSNSAGRKRDRDRDRSPHKRRSRDRHRHRDREHRDRDRKQKRHRWRSPSVGSDDVALEKQNRETPAEFGIIVAWVVVDVIVMIVGLFCAVIGIMWQWFPKAFSFYYSDMINLFIEFPAQRSDPSLGCMADPTKAYLNLPLLFHFYFGIGAVITGFLIFIVCLAGMINIVLKWPLKRKKLSLFICITQGIVLLLFVIALGIGIISWFMKSGKDEEVRELFQEGATDYINQLVNDNLACQWDNEDEQRTMLMHYINRKLECCGYQGSNDFSGQSKPIPLSCCKLYLGVLCETTGGMANDYVNVGGCAMPLKAVIDEVFKYVAIGGGLYLCICLFLIVTMFVLTKVSYKAADKAPDNCDDD